MSPLDLQRSHFDKLSGPKRWLLSEDQGHIAVLAEENFAELIKQQVEFFWDALEDRLMVEQYSETELELS